MGKRQIIKETKVSVNADETVLNGRDAVLIVR